LYHRYWNISESRIVGSIKERWSIMTDEKMNALGFVGLTDDEWTNIKYLDTKLAAF